MTLEVLETIEAARAAASAIGYPLVVRPLYATGDHARVAQNEGELQDAAARAIAVSPTGNFVLERCVPPPPKR